MSKLMALVLSLILAVSGFQAPAFGQGWNSYKFDELGFSVSCPDGWNVGKFNAGESGEMVAIILPKKAARSGFNANIVITSSIPEDKFMPLEQLYKLNLQAVASSPEFPKFKQINSYNIKLGGRFDAFQTTFTYYHPKIGIKLKSFQIYLKSGDRLYVIQYAAPDPSYKKYMDEVNDIVRSFEPIEKR